MRRRARKTKLACVVAVVGALAAMLPLAGAVPAAARPRGQAGTTVKVTVGDNFFKPKTITIVAGTTVRWVNKGHNLHDIKPNKGKKFGLDRLPPGKKYKFTFKKPGQYRYYCSFHGSPGHGQYGTVKVEAPPPSTESPPPSSAAFGKGFRAGRATSSARRTIEVPSDAKTVQAAVGRAKPGDLVLVSPGVYKEAVTVTTPRIVIRGLDRNRTILDGSFKLDNGVKVLDADGVAIENLTARNYKLNGFYWSGVDGYRGSYLTALRNGDYGIYAYESVDGQFDHSYAAGSPDAGFYIGACFPCNAVISDVEAEWNGIGYSGTNSGGHLYVVNSSWHDNRVGIVPNSGTGEELYPQHGATIVGNDIRDNNNGKTAAIEVAKLATGNGILLAGGNENVVERNLVTNHDVTGIAVIPLPEKLINTSDANAINFDARNNKVRDNIVRKSDAADLALVTTIASDTDTGGNCFAGNEFASSLPADLETLVPCDGSPSPSFKTDLVRFAALLTADKPPSADYRKVRLPERKLPNMPHAGNAKARAATDEPSIEVHVDTIEVPHG